MNFMVEMVGNMASFIGSLTVVGGALLWIYNSAIAKPREKRRKEEEDKRQGKMITLITQKNEPLNNAIKELNNLLVESQKDRKKLNEIAESNIEMIGKQLERKQTHYKNHTIKEIHKLDQTKREYERLLSELDRSTIPTKEQVQKLHWYMKHYGYINQNQSNQLNNFYNSNYPNNPFKK